MMPEVWEFYGEMSRNQPPLHTVVAQYLGFKPKGHGKTELTKAETQFMQPSKYVSFVGFDQLELHIQQAILEDAGCKTVDEYKEKIKAERAKLN